MRRARLAAAVALVGALLAWWALGGSEESQPETRTAVDTAIDDAVVYRGDPAQDPASDAEREAIARDYADAFDVSIERARQDLAGQEASHEVRHLVSKLAGDELIEVSLARTPEQHVAVYVTPEADVEAIRAALATSPIPYELTVQATPSSKELARISQEQVTPYLVDLPEVVGVSLDGPKAEIRLDILNVDDSRAQEIVDSIAPGGDLGSATLTYELHQGQIFP